MNDKTMNIEAQLPRIPDGSESPAVDLSGGTIESSPLHAPDAAPPAVAETLSPPGFIPPALGGPDDDMKLPLPAAAGHHAASDEAHQPPSATMEEEPASFDPAIFTAFAADPANRRELEHMHAQAKKLFHATVDKVYSMLSPGTVTRPASPVPEATANIRMLMVAQRQAEIQSRERRAVAEGMVVGSLLNVDNPRWNPMAPETGAAGTQSAVAALLRMEL